MYRKCYEHLVLIFHNKEDNCLNSNFQFHDLSVLVPVLQFFIEYGQFKSPPNRQSALPPTYFQAVLVLFQTTHFEEATYTDPCS